MVGSLQNAPLEFTTVPHILQGTSAPTYFGSSMSVPQWSQKTQRGAVACNVDVAISKSWSASEISRAEIAKFRSRRFQNCMLPVFIMEGLLAA